MANFRSVVVGDKFRFWRESFNSLLSSLGITSTDTAASYITTTAASGANKLVKTLGTGLIDPAFVPSATTTQSGVVELATTSETQAGTDAVRAVTPAGLKAAFGFSKSYDSGLQTITHNSTLTLTHGMGVEPWLIVAWLECTSVQSTYAVGDSIPFSAAMFPLQNNVGGITVKLNSAGTQIIAIIAINNINVLDAGNTAMSIDVTKWKLRIRALG